MTIPKIKFNNIQLVRIKVRVLKTGKVPAPKVEIDFFKLLILFKVSFIFKNSSRYGKSAGIIYSKNLNKYSKYYIKNCGIAKIT